MPPNAGWVSLVRDARTWTTVSTDATHDQEDDQRHRSQGGDREHQCWPIDDDDVAVRLHRVGWHHPRVERPLRDPPSLNAGMWSVEIATDQRFGRQFEGPSELNGRSVRPEHVLQSRLVVPVTFRKALDHQHARKAERPSAELALARRRDGDAPRRHVAS